MFDRDWPPPHAELSAAKAIISVDLIAPVTSYQSAKGVPAIGEGVPAMRTQRGEMLRLLNRGKNDLATDDGHDHARLGQVSSRRGEYVLRQDGEVGFFSVLQRSQSIL